MKAIRQEQHVYFRASILVVSLFILVLSTPSGIQQNDQFWPAIVAVGFVAFLANFPLRIFRGEITLISVVALGGGLIFGFQAAIWIIAVGALLGYSFRRIFQPTPFKNISKFRDWWFDLSFEVGINVIALVLAFSIFGDPERTILNTPAREFWGMATLPAIAFSLLTGLLSWLDGFIQWGYSVMANKRDISTLAIVKLLPVPLVFLGVEGYSYVGNIYILLIGGIPAVIAVLLYGLTVAKADLEKRVRELSTLSNISHALRSYPDLEVLLPVIQEQMMGVLNVKNFFVALVDFKTNQLWYPLAVKAGERRSWPRRPMADRLTDRVIREGIAITLTPRIQRGPNPIGLPPSETTPKSWIGVPLVTPDRIIGCLAVFHILNDVEFSQHDLNLLTTLSAQVSIALDNTLLYEQVQVRAAQLEKLNQFTGQITSSLELKEVISQVCQAVAHVGGSQRSAIYLYDLGEENVFLADSYGLSKEFDQRNRKFSISKGHRTQCLRMGKPVVVPDFLNATIPTEQVRMLLPDGIRAFADFPLAAPDGQFGFLSIFHDLPHEFQREEVELLQTFTSQAALWIANAKLHSATDEKLSRRVHQLTIIEAVGRELSAASHSEQLFSLILNYAIEFTQAPIGGIISYDSETGLVQFKANKGYPDLGFIPLDKGITARALKTGQIENVGDVNEDLDYHNAAEDKTRSQLSVPITHDGKVLGVITLESYALNAFSSNEQALVEQLANQAAVALVNAALYHDTQRHLSEQSTLYQIAASLVGALDVGAIAEILFQALNTISDPKYLGIYLGDKDVATYQLCFAEYCNNGSQLLFELPEHSLKNLLLDDTKMYLVSPNNIEEEIFSPKDFNGQAVLFPLIAANKTLGIVVLGFSTEYKISENLSSLMEAIAAQGAIAIQNAQLFVESTQRRKQLTAVINSVSESIVMINNDGVVTLHNQPFLSLTKGARDSISQSHLSDLSDEILAQLGYERNELIDLLEELADGKIPTSPREIYKIPGVEPVCVLERETLPVMGPGDQAQRLMIVWRDVTEEHKVNQEREAIADALIHDLRSPVSVVLGSIDLLDDSIPSEIRNEYINRSLQVARRGAKRVLRLIMSLLDVARMQSGRIELNRGPVDLAALVPELMIDIEMIAEEYNISVTNQVAEKLPVIFVDGDKISRVITNLLDNAVKFSPENGEVSVKAHAAGEEVIIQISDQGPGISDENRAIIFERYSQISGQLGRWRGAGLGLAFCRLAVEAHEGRIWIEDPPEGQGSIFIFSLPIR